MTTKEKQTAIIQEFIREYKLILPVAPDELEAYIAKNYPQLWEEFLSEKETMEIQEGETVLDFNDLAADVETVLDIASGAIYDSENDEDEENSEAFDRVRPLLAEAPTTLKALIKATEELRAHAADAKLILELLTVINKATGKA